MAPNAFPLDLSQFKKVSSDKQSTTMQHKDGHQIKVVHKALSPKLRSALAEMKAAAPSKHFDKGGAALDIVPAADSPNKSKPSGKTYSDSHSQQPLDIEPSENQAERPQYAEAGMVDTPTDAAESEDLAEQPETSPSAAPAPAPQQSSPAVTPQDIYKQAYQNHRGEFEKEDAAWQQDLANQHITPETYHTLFAKKDTLGKIGTIFGLVLAGGGAGVLHQPNAALQMMDRQIQNDLEAQKTSKANAQNFLRLSQQSALNQANIENLKKQGRLTEAQTAAQNADVQSKTMANILQYRAVSNNLDKLIGTLPPGSPQQINAIQFKQQLDGAMNIHLNNIKHQAAHQMSLNAVTDAAQPASQESPQPKKEEPQSSNKPFSPILKDSAEDTINNIKYDPTIPENQKTELEKEFVDSKQADAVLAAADPLFDKMKQTATPGGFIGRNVGHATAAVGAGIGSIFGHPAIGAAIGEGAKDVVGPAITQVRKQAGKAFANTPLGDVLGKATAKPREDEFSKERQYETYRNELGDLLRKVYPGIGGSEYSQKLSAISPDLNDTPDDIHQKRKAFEDLVKTAVKHGLLDSKGLTN